MKKSKKALAIIGATTISSVALVGCKSEFNPFYNEPMVLYGPPNKVTEDLGEVYRKQQEEEAKENGIKIEDKEEDIEVEKDIDTKKEFDPAEMEIMEMYGPAPN